MRNQGILAVLLVSVLGLGTITACDSGGSGGTGGTGGGGNGGGGNGGGGNGGNGGTGGNVGGNGGTGGQVAMPTCADYCTAISANCTGANSQYSSNDVCLAVCAAFTPGTSADTMGNTLGCRIYHAGAAASDPGTHCTHAGPGGDGLCGNNCEGFCDVVQHACTGANQQYADDAACLAECSGYPTTPDYSSNVASGDSFACRMYHATVASTAPDVHCEHVDEGTNDPADPCK